MNCRAIAAERLLLPGGTLERPLLLLHDGVVERLTSAAAEGAPPGTLHLEGATLAPGFLDIHVHGAGGRDVMEASRDAVGKIAAVLARHGTTRFLGTTVTASVESTLLALDGLANAIEGDADAEGARPIGIHLEGPFLSHEKRGVHPAADLQPPSIELFERMRNAARDHIHLLTIAPELPGAPALIAHAASLGIRISLGHSHATAMEARRGIAASNDTAPLQPVSATHTFNAMRAFDHREPGVLGVTLDDPQIFAELICDGIHTSQEAVRLWFRCKGEERAVLVTDGMAATGMPDGSYKLGQLDVTVRNGVCMAGGVLAGSVLTMDRAVANLQCFTGEPLSTAVRLATRNPAALLGLPDAEEPLAPGRHADLAVFAPGGQFLGTILRGRPLFML